MTHTPFLPPLGGPSDEEVAAAERVLEARKKAAKVQEGDTLVVCAGGGYITRGPAPCGKPFRIGEATAIQTQWYVEPYSCTGGDYWKNGEVRLECPHCGRELRLHNSPELTEIAKRAAKNLTTRQDSGK